ncbi:homoserine O-acetyltransferase MetX [Halomicrococcus gelatinilyticus]|uniref:homoserine O-acetyltransferase MetX n=1 Tax=Halomicrococcus gelatinilyticus TaxID=1702103 RepID=UPI002E14EF36
MTGTRDPANGTRARNDTRAARDPRDLTSGHVSLGRFEFERGGGVPDLEVAYETYGDPSDDAVLVCHALTGSHQVRLGRGAARSSEPEQDDELAQAAGWWDEVVGPGAPIDTTDKFVVCANVPGSCYGTTGPSSVDPRTGEPYGSDFPAVTVGDWVRAQRRLLDYLGVSVLHTVVGGSVGGMNAIEWAKRYPDRVERVVPIATGARLDPQLVALSAVARRALAVDPAWQGGDYYPDHPDRGLALARQIAHVTYRSKPSMTDQFGRELADSPPREFAPGAVPPSPGDGREDDAYRSVESYLDYNASQFVDRFDANSYLRLTRAMETYDLAAGHESDADALAEFDGEALVFSFTSDWHFTTAQGDALATAFDEAGADATHRVVETDYGHDAFLARPELISAPLRRFVSSGSDFAPVHAGLFAN